MIQDFLLGLITTVVVVGVLIGVGHLALTFNDLFKEGKKSPHTFPERLLAGMLISGILISLTIIGMVMRSVYV